MIKNNTWLTASIFCHKSTWCIILTEAVVPFLNCPEVAGFIDSYQIEFNYLRGDNIRFALSCCSDQKEIIAQKLDMHFSEFFLLNRFQAKVGKLPLNSVFLPFPANTVQYGLFNIADGNIGSTSNGIQKKISYCILAGFSKEIISDESTILFAFYLNIGLLKALCKCINRSNLFPVIIFYDDLYKASFFEQTTSNVKQVDLNTAFEVNKSILNDIYNDVMKDKPNALSPWLVDWISFVEQELLRCALGSREDTKGLTMTFDRISGYIQKRLCLSDIMRDVLYYFIIGVLPENVADVKGPHRIMTRKL